MPPDPGGYFVVSPRRRWIFQEFLAIVRQPFMGICIKRIEFDGFLIATHGILEGVTAIIQSPADDIASQTPQAS
jgi:hypothetical protein